MKARPLVAQSSPNLLRAAGESERGSPKMQGSHESANADVDLFRGLVAEAPDAVIFADRDGTIQVWNRGAERLFGYAAAEVVGASLDVIIPDRLRRAHWDGYHRAIDSGRTKHGNRVLTTRSVHKDGRKLYVDLSFGLVRDRAGTVVGAMAMGRDGTARYVSDQALRARIVELEQKVKTAKDG